LFCTKILHRHIPFLTYSFVYQFDLIYKPCSIYYFAFKIAKWRSQCFSSNLLIKIAKVTVGCLTCTT